MTIIEIAWKPPEGSKFRFVHWSLLRDLDAALAYYTPDVVYRDKSGSYWIPLDGQDDR